MTEQTQTQTFDQFAAASSEALTNLVRTKVQESPPQEVTEGNMTEQEVVDAVLQTMGFSFTGMVNALLFAYREGNTPEEVANDVFVVTQEAALMRALSNMFGV